MLRSTAAIIAILTASRALKTTEEEGLSTFHGEGHIISFPNKNGRNSGFNTCPIKSIVSILEEGTDEFI